jgi:hypothetical protein
MPVVGQAQPGSHSWHTDESAPFSTELYLPTGQAVTAMEEMGQ